MYDPFILSECNESKEAKLMDERKSKKQFKIVTFKTGR